MSPVAAVELALWYHSEQTFLKFAAEVAKEAKRLNDKAQKTPGQQLQLQLL